VHAISSNRSRRKARGEEFVLVEASPGATDPTQLNAVIQDIVGKARVLDNTHDNSGSVVYGLHFTASIITGAALMMVSVFGGFALGPRAMFQ
jgi:hypothetical protein